MTSTAKRYDLKINSLIDERQDPHKSTWAAARYLRDLYAIFGDWTLVIAAYNCGPNNVKKAISRADGARDYWAIYPYLPRETRGYVPAFIAANYIMNYYCEHNICPMKTRLPISTDTVTVTRDLHMQQIADLCQIDKEAIRALNPQYRTDVIPGSSGPMSVCLPIETISSFLAYKDSIYNYRADELLTRRTTVAVNEAAVAPRTTSRYSGSSRSARTSRSRKAKSRQRSKSVTVRRGDTLSDIARRNGTTVKKLRQLNGIKGSLINQGKKIRVR